MKIWCFLCQCDLILAIIMPDMVFFLFAVFSVIEFHFILELVAEVSCIFISFSNFSSFVFSFVYKITPTIWEERGKSHLIAIQEGTHKKKSREEDIQVFFCIEVFKKLKIFCLKDLIFKIRLVT